MGFFTKEELPQVPPNKAKRLECWDARDRFFECLTKHNIDNSLDAKEQANVQANCGELRAEFKAKCVASWFKYFQEKRYNDGLRQKYTEKLKAEGAQELPFKLGPR